MKFEHLFSPMQVGSKTYRNRIVSAPMAFGLIVQNPEARDFTYRKLEASAKGGNGCVIVGETDVNFVDAVRIPGFRPFDFAKPEEDMETFQAVGEYARRIKRHGAVALAELVHCGKEKVPFGPNEEAIGPIETTNLAGVKVRAMNEDDMARIAKDFAVAATYMQKAGFDGVLVHGGHGFIFTQFLSPLMNTRTDNYGGSLENRARFPLQILKAIREAESYPGPAIVIAYCPCLEHGIKAGMSCTQEEMKKAVECGYWHLYRYDPRRIAEGKNPFQLDSPEPDSGKMMDYLKGENRYASLQINFPDRAQRLYEKTVQDAKDRYAKYRKMAED